MKFPHSVRTGLDEVSEIVAKWPIRVDFDSVVKWVLQFDPQDYLLAIRILHHLNVIGQEDINSALSIAYSKLTRKAIDKGAKISNKNTLFAGIGAAGKSGSMLSYHFRLINEISEENFLGPETQQYLEQGKIENIVLVDDIVSTGKQASTEIKELTEKVTPLGVKNIFVLSVCGFRDGIAKVETDTKAYTFAAFEYGPEDTVASLDSHFYEGLPYDKRRQLLDRLDYYGSICSKSGMGYGGIGSLIVFHYNTPNSTIPVIWGDLNDWIPLFRRVRRINGITSYYSQFDKAVESKVAEAKKEAAATPPQEQKSQPAELTIFVEGKLDELFFDELAEKKELASKLGFSQISVVALGTSYLSRRLIETLSKTTWPALLVVDEYPGSSVRVDSQTTGVFGMPCVILKPNILCLSSILDIYIDDEFGGELGYLPPEPATIPPLEAYAFAEKTLLKGRPQSVIQERVRRIVKYFIDDGALEAFVERAKKALADHAALARHAP